MSLLTRLSHCLGPIVLVIAATLAAPPTASAAPTTKESVPAAAATSETFRNPIREGAADPYMVHVDGHYYLTYTAVDRIIIVKATSVADLGSAPATTVWTDDTPERCCNMWAPEIHQVGDKWYLYYSASESGDISTERSFVLEADDIEGPWTFKGELATEDGFAIDGTVGEIDGQLYYFWSQIHSGDPQAIYVSAMSNPWTLTGTKTRISTPDQDWEQHEGVVNEGPIVLAHDGKVNVFYSGSQCKSQYYAVGQLSWDGGEVTDADSWSKQGPVFGSNADNHVFGPGHNSFFTSPDGSEVWNLYHAVTSRDGAPRGACDGTRSARIDKVSFDADGNPDLGEPSSSWESQPLPSGDPGATPLPDGRYQINPADIPGATLDVYDCSTEDNAAISVYTNFPSDCQYWDITSLDDGSGAYKIINSHSGHALDVHGCSAENGTKLQQYHYWGGDCQKWYIHKMGDSYRLQPVRGGKALSVAGCSTTVRAAVQTWWYHEAACQKWELAEV